MRFLYSFNIYTKIFTSTDVKRPKSFSSKRQLKESFANYRKRLKQVKVYIKAMKNGIEKLV